MGADIAIAIIVVPTKINDNLEVAFTNIKKLVNTMTEKEISEYLENKYCGLTDGEPQQTKNDILTNIELLRLTLMEGTRDTTYFYHCGCTIYVTVGMAWGDSLTDSYDVFNDFYNLPKRITGLLTGNET